MTCSTYNFLLIDILNGYIVLQRENVHQFLVHFSSLFFFLYFVQSESNLIIEQLIMFPVLI